MRYTDPMMNAKVTVKEIDRYRHPKRYHAKVYVFNAGEHGSRAKEIRAMRRIVEETLEKEGVKYERLAFSQYCGCSCGCSPGFTATYPTKLVEVYIDCAPKVELPAERTW